MSDEKIRYRVMYKPTGQNFPGDRPIKPGMQGEFQFRTAADSEKSADEITGALLNAEDAVKACLKWFNERVVEAEVKNELGQTVRPELRIKSENVVAWIDEYHGDTLVESGEPCAEESLDMESEQNTSSETSRSPKKSSTKHSRTVPSELAPA